MLGYFHPIYHDNARVEFTQERELFKRQVPTYRRLLGMCKHVRIYGIYALFMDYDVSMFHRALQASGRAFLHHLPRIPVDSRYLGIAAPYFDALAADDLKCIEGIRPHIPPTFNKEGEYEEDYLFIKIIDGLLTKTSTDILQAHILRYEEVIEGAFDPRLELVNALMNQNVEGFDIALKELVMKHEDHYRALKEKDELLDAHLYSEGAIFIQGLALLRLATILGIPTQEHYAGMPSVVRGDSAQYSSPDFWQTL